MSHFTEDWTSFNFDKVVELYASVGWVAHAQNKESLYKAYCNSTFVQLAFEDVTGRNFEYQYQD